jgi:predicted acetyltransferase
MELELVEPSETYAPAWADALRRGWSPNTERPEAAQEVLEEYELDPAGVIATARGELAADATVTLPDGSVVPRLPGFSRWMWDGEFCGSINVRWAPGTTDLPPHCLGHIGYAVVPWKQGRGYATAALGLVLPLAAAQGLPFVEITTDEDNVASQKVVAANGGVLVERFTKPATSRPGICLRWRVPLG